MPLYTMGVDIGSAASKCAIMLGGASLAATAVVPAGTGTSGPARCVESALKSAGLAPGDIRYAAATGYGRNTVQNADRTFTELSCHAKGAAWLCPGVRTVIDMGGQDCKALSLSPSGELMNFVMNDKCAAGTGRFLEVMARILEIGVGDMGELSERAQSRVDISSTCTVFAESEVISKLSTGADIYDLLAGINRSVAVRAAGLVKRLGAVPPVLMTGGAAKNSGVVRALEAELGLEVMTHELSQLAGAIGAALTFS